ncbi:MFS monocarboxylic acid transporter [Apiospora kogelbergensis]|uniref:MFS monocarboxylic acid transporter n=1 Tax=Apiospora kogelbergensis TaxID=1337665 RepID=UPI00313221DB
MAFIGSLLAAAAAGTITVFSLYGPSFQSRLRFTQFEINGVASAMSLALYIPVPLIGYMCDRTGPSSIALISAALLGGGYGLAAGLYHKGDVALGGLGRNDPVIFPFMVFAFVLIGAGTACVYVASVTTCAKNFSKGKIPRLDAGSSDCNSWVQRSPGEFSVFYFFVFLSVTLTFVGLFGTFTLRVIDEDELINEAVEELERSGLLEGSEIFRRRSTTSGYGIASTGEDPEDGGIGNPTKDDDEDNDALKKTWLLNAETRRFLSDHTMWWFALGFWLIIGPGEAFINNFGTVIGTLHTPHISESVTTPATHVSIIAATNTVARLVVGSLSDFASPKPQSAHPQGGLHLSSAPAGQRLTISRITMIIVAGIIISLGTLILATGAMQEHGDRFWTVSSLIGAGYGGLFSLMPIIVTIIWGVENFGTNFGIVALFPAIGSTMWGLIYSAVYEAGANNSDPSTHSEDDTFCYGTKCYSLTFWAMTGSIWVGCGMILWAWKGRNGWAQRGVVI